MCPPAPAASISQGLSHPSASFLRYRNRESISHDGREVMGSFNVKISAKSKFRRRSWAWILKRLAKTHFKRTSAVFVLFESKSPSKNSFVEQLQKPAKSVFILGRIRNLINRWIHGLLNNYIGHQKDNFYIPTSDNHIIVCMDGWEPFSG
jgi:hypothetical protein